MSWLISFLAALLSGIAGLLLAGFIASACVSWYHIPNREGAAGYYVIFLAIGGGIAGFIIGLIVARIVAGNIGPGFGREFGVAIAVIVVIAGIFALLARVFADVPPEIDGRDLSLEVEFRFPETPPAEEAPTASGEWDFRLASLAGNTQRTFRLGKVHSENARIEEGRWIVPAEVPVFTSRGKRVVLLQRDSEAPNGFLVPLPSRPGRRSLEWSDWLPAGVADKLSFRFRVQKTVPPPPPKSQAEYQAEEDARKEAEFAAIPADAPVEVFFPYLDYEQPQTERALQQVSARPNLAAELGQLAVGDDADLADKALRVIEKLPEPTPDFIAPVEAAGRDIAERLRRVNATSAEEDPGYHGAAAVSLRFIGWISAARRLRETCGGDFTPELQKILELSRERPDSQSLRMDVCRVASYYLHQWAGIAPLPTDPPPR